MRSSKMDIKPLPIGLYFAETDRLARGYPRISAFYIT